MTIIKRASVFMLLAQSFIHFRPSPSYEKYFKFLVGIMTTVIFTVPLLELLQRGTIQEYQQRAAYHMDRLKELSERQLSGQDFTAWETSSMLSPVDSYLATSEWEIKARLNNYESKQGLTVKDVKLSYGEEAEAYKAYETGHEAYQAYAEREEHLHLLITLGMAGDETGIQIDRIDKIDSIDPIDPVNVNDTASGQADGTYGVKQQSSEAAMAKQQESEIKSELAALLEMDEERLEVKICE